MSEPLTLEEINSRFDSEWVLIGEPEVDANLNVSRGRVLWHDKDRDSLYDKMLELRPTDCAIHCTGTPPDDEVIVL